MEGYEIPHCRFDSATETTNSASSVPYTEPAQDLSRKQSTMHG